MAHYTLLSTGTTHFDAEEYCVTLTPTISDNGDHPGEIENKLDYFFSDDNSRRKTIQRYLDEIDRIAPGYSQIGIIHSLYEYLIQHKDWIWKHNLFYQIVIRKLWEFEFSDLPREEDFELFTAYRQALTPKLAYLKLNEEKPNGTLSVYRFNDPSNALTFSQYLYSEYLVLNDLSFQHLWTSKTCEVVMILLWVDNRVRGYAYLRISRMKNSSGWISEKSSLKSIHITRENRRKGYGRQILELLRREIPRGYFLRSPVGRG